MCEGWLRAGGADRDAVLDPVGGSARPIWARPSDDCWQTSFHRWAVDRQDMVFLQFSSGFP